MEQPDMDPRKAVWLALSEFYLDTELQDQDLARLRSVMQQSGYTRAEIQQINYEEVAPVLIDNLRSVAGVWGAFEEVWLLDRIAANLKQRGNRRPARWATWLWHRRVDYWTKSYMEIVCRVD